jgi:hypothetical protein
MEHLLNGAYNQASRLHAGKYSLTEMNTSAQSAKKRARTDVSKSLRTRILKLSKLNGTTERKVRTRDLRLSTLMKLKTLRPRE